ncbi:MAG: rod-binding protein [Candidatus Anammoxibacter sp.]
MSNLIELYRTHETFSLSKIEQAQKNISSLQKKTGIGLTQQFGSDKGNDLDARDLRLKEATRDFEKIFLTYMIKDMWKAIPSDEESGMPGGEIYLEMAQSALAGALAKGEGIGIGKLLYQQMKSQMNQGNNIEKPINEDKNEK